MKNKPKNINDQLLVAFGPDCVYVEIQNGWQARFADRVYTFYTGKSHKLSISPDRWVVYQPGKEIEAILLDRKISKEVIKKAVSKVPGYSTPKDQTNPTGLEGFIEHIKRKLDTYRRVHSQKITGEQTQAMVIMQCLIEEAEQYK